MRRDPSRRRPGESPLRYARRLYRAARSRALYWSGNLTFTGRRYVPRRRPTMDAELMYELAIDNCRRWEAELASLGHAPATPYDPHRLLNQRWSRFNSAMNRPTGELTP